MTNITGAARTSHFAMKELPSENCRIVETMKVGDVSAPFRMTDIRGKEVCAIIKLKSRVE